MKKFILKIILFIAIVIVADFLIGLCLQQLQSKAKGGDTKRNEYIMSQIDEDIVIFGSSRAIHHYDTQLICDSIGLSCYNCGQDGNGIILAYARLCAMLQYHIPKMIIYDIETRFDVIVSDNSRSLVWLRPYYSYDNSLYDVFQLVSHTEKYKMLSMCYRYNGKLLQLISDYISPKQNDINGFRPLTEVITTAANETEFMASGDVDALKLNYVERFIAKCKEYNIPLIFFISPGYNCIYDDTSIAPIRQLCNQYNVPLYNHYNDSAICADKNNFKDRTHLNGTGAARYSTLILSEIKEAL